MDHQPRAGAVKRRVHSLFRQGRLLYGLIANWPEASLRTLVKRNHDLLRRNIVFAQARGFV